MTKEIVHLEDHRGRLHCDACGHTLEEGDVTYGPHLIGYPCPECGNNMLTAIDYEAAERIHRMIAWINKWLGPIFGREYSPNDPTWNSAISIKHHAGTTEMKVEKIDARLP